MDMTLNVLPIIKLISITPRHYFTLENKWIWGIRSQEGNKGGSIFPSLIRGYVLLLSHISTEMNQMISINQIVIML